MSLKESVSLTPDQARHLVAGDHFDEFATGASTTVLFTSFMMLLNISGDVKFHRGTGNVHKNINCLRG